MIMMEFEENFLDLIVSECTSNTLFDEYVNYEQIVSESLVLSESQEIKLSILREFSIKDIGKRIASAFKAIKTFIGNLILKLNVFIKNLGKDKLFKEVGKALTELDPEKRKETIKYNRYNRFEVRDMKPEVTKKMDNCINYVMKALKSKNIDVDVYYTDIHDKYGILDAKDLEMDVEVNIEWAENYDTRIEVYKNYTWMSKNLDKAYNYFTKLSNKISNQADKLEKLSDRWTDEDDDLDKIKIAAKVSRQILLPAIKKNVQGLKDLASSLANDNKEILTKAIGLIKGDKSAIKDAKFDAGTVDSTNESYDPWEGLE